MSAEFMCSTQVSHMQSFNAPSGESYNSMKGYFFTVHNPLDIAFFEKKDNFQKKGLLSKPKNKPDVSADEAFKEKLSKVKGLDKRTEKKLIERYETFEIFKDALDNDGLEDISKGAIDALKKAFGRDE